MLRKTLLITTAVLVLGIGLLSARRLVPARMVKVPTGSMANTILPGDRLTVNEISAPITRGELVIFRSPADPSSEFVSRVIGLPGETIEVRDKFIYINGTELPEHRIIVKEDIDAVVLNELSSEGSGPYNAYYSSSSSEMREPVPYGGNGPFQIPQAYYFVMGDNRDNSFDSRFWGTVPRESISGSPSMIYWSSSPPATHEQHVRWERIGNKIH